MDQRVLIFVALICLSSPIYGRSWLGPEDHPSDNGFAFKPHHNHKGYGDQETDYDSSEEVWDPNDDYTNYHRHAHDYGHHGYNHHVNHDHHEFHYYHHNHHNFRNVHNHGRHESHEEHHSHNNPQLGTCRHNHDDRPNYQDHGQNNDENINGQNRGTTESPRNSQGNINNEPNENPRAIDKENGGPTADSSNIGSTNENSGSPVTEPPKSGLPNDSPGLPREILTGDSDRVVFPDNPPAPITSSPLQPRLLSTPEAITQAPLQNFTTQAPRTEAPVQAPTTPALPEVVKCVRACPATSEYNPVCGSNNVTYNNPGFLQCARNCGVDVTVARQAPCPRAIPLPLLKLLAETFNATMEDQEPRKKRAAEVFDDITNNSKEAETLGKHKRSKLIHLG